jgi:hypothetical protein
MVWLGHSNKNRRGLEGSHHTAILTFNVETDGVIDVARHDKSIVLHQCCIGLAGLFTQVG